uniref:Uncharacterized protein n=1 Tax=Cucumis melo TaxID=3656 RepID=A0A9I9EM25_CUCME
SLLIIFLFACVLFLIEVYVVNVAEIGKEDEVSGNIGSYSMFTWVKCLALMKVEFNWVKLKCLMQQLGTLQSLRTEPSTTTGLIIVGPVEDSKSKCWVFLILLVE